jgi:hypothetical protein
MTDFEAGYLQALSDIHSTVWQAAQQIGTHSEGRLELLGVISLLNEQIRVRAADWGGIEPDEPAK